MTARDELAAIIEAHMFGLYADDAELLADKIIAAGWRAPNRRPRCPRCEWRDGYNDCENGEAWEHAEPEDRDATLQADAYERGPEPTAEPIRSLEGLLPIRRGCDVEPLDGRGAE